MATTATRAAESMPPACRNLLCVSMNHIKHPHLFLAYTLKTGALTPSLWTAQSVPTSPLSY